MGHPLAWSVLLVVELQFCHSGDWDCRCWRPSLLQGSLGEKQAPGVAFTEWLIQLYMFS